MYIYGVYIWCMYMVYIYDNGLGWFARKVANIKRNCFIRIFEFLERAVQRQGSNSLLKLFYSSASDLISDSITVRQKTAHVPLASFM